MYNVHIKGAAQLATHSCSVLELRTAETALR